MGVWLGCLTAAFAAYVAQLAAILLMEHRRQAHMTAWLFIAFVCPFIGFAAYWLMGRRPRTGRKREVESAAQTGADAGAKSDARTSGENGTKVDAAREVHDRIQPPVKPHVRAGTDLVGAHEQQLTHLDGLADVTAKPSLVNNAEKKRQDRLFALLRKLAPFPMTGHNETRVLTDGEMTFRAMLEEMKRAKHHIHMDYYTIRNDGVGSRFLKVLVEKARAGVEVRIVYDGIGSLHLDKRYLDALDKAGGHSACFSPLRHSMFNRRLNFRNHRKIMVIDGQTGFLGGINIGDEYVGLDERLGFWRDTHLMVRGDAASQLQELFMEDWEKAAGESLPRECGHYFPGHTFGGEENVLIVPGKPGINDQQVVEVLHTAMASARTSIYAATPYFIPDPSVAAGLRIAARSGIDVKLIIPGVSDSKLVLLATLSHVQDMLDAGVQIYRYRKGFIHAKVMIIDKMIATVGTANLDMRSFYSNYELLALLFDEKPIGRLLADFRHDLKHSTAIDPVLFASRPRKQKAAEAVMHILSPLL